MTALGMKALLPLLLIPVLATEVEPAPIAWASEIFETVRSYQFVFTVKTEGNRIVEQTLQKFLCYTWNLDASAILVTDTKLLRRYSPFRHQLIRFVQVLLTQESERGMPNANPIWLTDYDLIAFNLHTGIYTDIYLVFNIKTPKSIWMFLRRNEHCMIPSNYHIFQISPDGGWINGALHMEPLTGDVTWVSCYNIFKAF